MRRVTRIFAVLLVLISAVPMFAEGMWDELNLDDEVEVFDISWNVYNHEVGMFILGKNALMFGDTFHSKVILLLFDESELPEIKKLAFECKQLVTSQRYHSDYEKNDIFKTVSDKILKRAPKDNIFVDYDEIDEFGFTEITYACTKTFNDTFVD